jgi:hypothetical protein
MFKDVSTILLHILLVYTLQSCTVYNTMHVAGIWRSCGLLTQCALYLHTDGCYCVYTRLERTTLWKAIVVQK